MTELVITRGLPASGKTMFARIWVDRDRAHRARVNRDDLRRMVDDGVFVKGETEQRIQALRNAAIKSLLDRGVSVVCDDTNLPNRVVRDLVTLAARAKAEWRIEDFTTVQLDVCTARNAARTDKDPVPRHVIEDMHLRHLHGKVLPLPFYPFSAEAPGASLYEPDDSLPDAFI